MAKLFLVQKDGNNGIWVTDGVEAMWPLGRGSTMAELTQLGIVANGVVHMNADEFAGLQVVVRNVGDSITWDE